MSNGNEIDSAKSESLNIVKKEIPFVYPNPTTNTFKVKGLKEFIGASIEIYTTIGVKLLTIKILNNEELIDLSRYNNGIYIIKIEGLDHPINISKSE